MDVDATARLCVRATLECHACAETVITCVTCKVAQEGAVGSEDGVRALACVGYWCARACSTYPTHPTPLV